MNRKFHISKDMVLCIVIGILNVNLMRKKDQQGEPEEKRREKRRGSTTNSAEMRSKVLDIARPQWWEASVQQYLTAVPSVTLKYIRQMWFVNTSDLGLYALQCSPTKRLFVQIQIAYINTT